MFKSVAAKLAHSSKVPVLAGNSRLQPLQEAIAAEKNLLQTCVRGPAQAALHNPDPRFQSPGTQHDL